MLPVMLLALALVAYVRRPAQDGDRIRPVLLLAGTGACAGLQELHVADG